MEGYPDLENVKVTGTQPSALVLGPSSKSGVSPLNLYAQLSGTYVAVPSTIENNPRHIISSRIVSNATEEKLLLTAVTGLCDRSTTNDSAPCIPL